MTMISAIVLGSRRVVLFREHGDLAHYLGLAYIASCSVPTLVPLPAGVTLSHALTLASLPVWFVTLLTRPTPVLDRVASIAAGAIIGCCLVLMLLAAFSAFGADIPFRVSRPIVSLLTGPALIILLVGTTNDDRFERYLVVWCTVLAATAIVSAVAMVEPTLRSFIFGTSDRASGFFKNPNQYGIALAVTIPAALSIAVAGTRHRALWFAITVVLLMALMLSGSKANLLLTALTVPTCLMLFVFILFSGPARVAMMSVTIFGCLSIGAAALTVLALINPRAVRLLNEAVVEGEQTHSMVARERIWGESIRLFLENPVLGVGAGQPILGYSHSHNLLLDYARMLGVPGLTVMTLFILTVLVTTGLIVLAALRADWARPEDRLLCVGLSAGPVVYLAANMSSDSFGPTTSPFLFLTLAFCLVARKALVRPGRRW